MVAVGGAAVGALAGLGVEGGGVALLLGRLGHVFFRAKAGDARLLLEQREFGRVWEPGGSLGRGFSGVCLCNFVTTTTMIYVYY